MVVVQLDFVDRSDGWVLAQDDDGDSLVIATHDGGRSWRRCRRRRPYVSDIYATSATNVWLIVGARSTPDGPGFEIPTVDRLHSTDGGCTWTDRDGRRAGVAVRHRGRRRLGLRGRRRHPHVERRRRDLAGRRARASSTGSPAADAVSATDVWAVDASGRPAAQHRRRALRRAAGAARAGRQRSSASSFPDAATAGSWAATTSTATAA